MSLFAEYFSPPRAMNRLKAESQKAIYRGFILRTFAMIAVLLTLSSCTHTYQFTYTKKSGMEQLLVTKAVDEAIQMMTVDMKGSKVFVDVACLMKDERSYIRKAFIHWFLDAGAFISEYPLDADYIVSVLVKVAGTDGDQLFFGIPSVPIPLTISIATPTLTIFNRMNQEGRAEMEVMIYSAEAGIREKFPSLKGNSYYKKYVIVFVPYTRKNIP